MRTVMEEGWFRSELPVVELRGNTYPEEFVLLHGHIDAWDVGVGDNATGDATMPDVARVLHAHRHELRRSVRIAWWLGHSTGRYAGSTWYADAFALELDEGCVAQINCDSPGRRWATEYTGVSRTPETAAFAERVIADVTGKAMAGVRAHQAGDYSFDNIGISWHFMLISTMLDELRRKQGYYAVGGCGGNIEWHTEHDTIEIADRDVLHADVEIYLLAVLRHARAEVIAFDWSTAAEEFRQTLSRYADAAGDRFDLGPAADAVEQPRAALERFYDRVGGGPRGRGRDPGGADCGRCTRDARELGAAARNHSTIVPDATRNRLVPCQRSTRMRMTPPLKPIGLVLALALALATSQAQPQCTPENTLVAATIDMPVNMDPAFAELYASMQVYQHIFAKVVELDVDYGIRPNLAESWTQDSETSWTFRLVQNATFHNGDPVTAHDVKYSIDRVLDPDVGASNAIFLAPITSVEVIDDHTVRIHVEEGWGGLLQALAAVGDVVSQRAIEAADPRLEPVGAGPYQMVNWVQGDHVLLARHEGYHRDAPHFDCIEMRAVSEDAVRQTGLVTGEFGWIEQVPLQRAEGLKDDAGFGFHSGGPYLPDLVLFNNARPPFDDVRVRQAVAWALDREVIANIVFFGQAVPATEAISDLSPMFAGIDPYADGPDLERARALIEEAGAVGARVVFAGQPQVATAFRTGQLMQEQLRQIGLEVEIVSHEPALWFAALATGDFDFTITFWSATIDPEHFYLPILHSQSPWNFPRYADERMDEALEAFRFSSDPEARQEAYRRVVELAAEEVPVLFTINKVINYWTAPHQTGATPRPSLELRLDLVRPE